MFSNIIRVGLTLMLGLTALTSAAQSAEISISTDNTIGFHDGRSMVVTAPLADTLTFDGGSGSIGFYPRPYLSGSATATGSDTVGTRVFTTASVEYFFSISGPSATELVPISFAGKASVSMDGELSGGASANIRIFGSAGTFYTMTCQANYACPADSDGTFTGSILLRPLDMGSVSMRVEIAAISYSSIGSSGSAFIDPYFFIDPDFLVDHPGYSLAFSNVGNEPFNTTPVPEPETYAMLIAGLGMLTRFVRRSKKKS